MERGVILRYGMLSGPGTWYAPNGPIAEQVRMVSWLLMRASPHSCTLMLLHMLLYWG
ncbi:hypothetical protein KSF_112600 [Reticulibacter mediterranei]|uniref:Uncharacterized protein n=1 Tax=Reticulibacter mediterranei TaxID=2778369 RepID=A0A8J3N792_9CHLR|nr:hypothetical protein KSF_112600 [Reticulibacter mediterranei]